MTEQDWLTCCDPQRMIESLPHEKWGGRRARLFCVECCRRIPVLPDERLAGVIDTVERYADGAADDTELSAANDAVTDCVEWEARHDMGSWRSHAAEVVAAAVRVPPDEYSAITELCDWAITTPDTKGDSRLVTVRMLGSMAEVVREIVGNPFRPVAADASWLTSDVLALAKGIYEERAFDRMPILADALQDAGCDNADVLEHCRGPGPHVRGCWAVDLVLGKA